MGNLFFAICCGGRDPVCEVGSQLCHGAVADPVGGVGVLQELGLVEIDHIGVVLWVEVLWVVV